MGMAREGGRGRKGDAVALGGGVGGTVITGGRQLPS